MAIVLAVAIVSGGGGLVDVVGMSALALTVRAAGCRADPGFLSLALPAARIG
ncbi:MAG: hypothetical protein ACRDRJ_02710 [Streptosporangiaceae bacterium]